MSDVPQGAATVGDCPRCDEQSRLRVRTFSDQATAALVAWRELDENTVGQPICDSCYDELREVMIDRADDLAAGNMEPETPSMPAATPKTAAPAAAKTPAKAPAPAPVAKDKGKVVAAAPSAKDKVKGKSVKKAG